MRSLATLLSILLSLLTAQSSLDAEISTLSSDLSTTQNGIRNDFAVTIDRRLLSEIATRFARASQVDVRIKVLPGRLFSSTSDLGFAKYQNYLDIVGGGGALDLRDARALSVSDGRVVVYADLSGRLKTEAKGRHIGFNYTTEPDIGVTLRDQIPFSLEPSGVGFHLRPTAKNVTAKLNINVPVSISGSNLSTNRDVQLNTASILKPIPLPSLIDQQMQERQLVIERLFYSAEAGKLRLGGRVAFLKREKSREK